MAIIRSWQSGATDGFWRNIPSSDIESTCANFDQKLKVFKDAKPLSTEKHSMNEIHDHRSVTNDVNIHVAGGFPVEKTERPLGARKMQIQLEIRQAMLRDLFGANF